MIVSKTPVKTMPRWLERLLTACMVLVLPLGVAYAQTADIKAVAGRLQRAVKAGELSKKDMKVMLGALKKSTAERQPRARDARREVEPPEFDRAWFAKTKAKISGAVKDGILTEREAEKKLIELEKKAFERSGKTTRRKTRSSSRDAEMKIFEIKQWLDGAVQRGELTRQEADKKLKEVARKLTPERSANDYMDKAKSKDKAKNKDKNKSKDKAKSKAKNKGKRRAERAARKAERKDKKERRRIGEEADPTIEKVVRR